MLCIFFYPSNMVRCIVVIVAFTPINKRGIFYGKWGMLFYANGVNGVRCFAVKRR